MLFKIRLAEKVIQINSRYDWVYHLCTSYLVKEDLVPDILVEANEQDLDLEKAILRKKISPDYHIDPCFMESHAIHRKIADSMILFNTILMHGSAISTNGNGYMIVAASGVGKTLRSNLWIETIPESFILNGDKPLVRILKDSVTVYGTPWCGKEGKNRNDKSILKAIFFLERADNEEHTTLTEIDIGKALPSLLLQTYFSSNSEDIIKTIQLFNIMATNVKFYRFRSTPTRESVRVAYETVFNL